jgi:hypothetical protein
MQIYTRMRSFLGLMKSERVCVYVCGIDTEAVVAVAREWSGEEDVCWLEEGGAGRERRRKEEDERNRGRKERGE